MKKQQIKADQNSYNFIITEDPGSWTVKAAVPILRWWSIVMVVVTTSTNTTKVMVWEKNNRSPPQNGDSGFYSPGPWVLCNDEIVRILICFYLLFFRFITPKFQVTDFLILIFILIFSLSQYWIINIFVNISMTITFDPFLWSIRYFDAWSHRVDYFYLIHPL